ncbi:sensor histidine kinase [Zhongshania arctica]|uniref:histidine kinase n=1 Tax=Zhongshania arctica TaxID=3238302 RepID=A0ABV3TXF2_9GAMM
MLKQSTNAMPFMALFAANTLVCFVLMFMMTAYFVSNSGSGDHSYSNVGVLIGKLMRASNSEAEVVKVISSLALDNDIGAVCLYAGGSSSFTLLAQSQYAARDIACDAELGAGNQGGILVLEETIDWRAVDGEVASFKLIIKPRHEGVSPYLLMTMWGTLLLVLCLLWAWWLSTRASRRMMAPVYRLLDVMKMVTESRDYSIRADVISHDAFGALSENFNAMIADVESRNHEIVTARGELEVRVREVDISNRELSNALLRLKSTQQKLISNEKMALLGGLVAGVAHEINTPVGIGVTAASTLLESTNSVSKKYAQGQLTNSALLQYIKHATAAADIILGNLHRAASLIQSFKQVAVDQSASDVRTFDLKEYLSQVLLSLRPQLRKTNLKCEFDCPSDLEIRSYPGALSQIVTNFVMNAIVHAFEKDDEGTLLLQVSECEHDVICIRFSDDGRGISPENLTRVWDPFFTTNRSGGGSGLGLHIVYNLVTQKLFGNIEIESTEGEGTIISLFLGKDVGEVRSYE